MSGAPWSHEVHLRISKDGDIAALLCSCPTAIHLHGDFLNNFYHFYKEIPFLQLMTTSKCSFTSNIRSLFPIHCVEICFSLSSPSLLRGSVQTTKYYFSDKHAYIILLIVAYRRINACYPLWLYLTRAGMGYWLDCDDTSCGMDHLFFAVVFEGD